MTPPPYSDHGAGDELARVRAERDHALAQLATARAALAQIAEAAPSEGDLAAGRASRALRRSAPCAGCDYGVEGRTQHRFGCRAVSTRVVLSVDVKETTR